MPTGSILRMGLGVKAPTLGSELVLNGGFASATTSWTGTNCTLASTAGGQAGNCLTATQSAGTSGQTVTQSIASLTVGRLYELRGFVKAGTAPDKTVSIGIATIGATSATATATWTEYIYLFVATATTHVVTLTQNFGAATETMLWDTISMKPITL